MADDITVTLDARSRRTLDELVRAWGRENVLERLRKFFEREAQLTAAHIVRNYLRGQALGKRTGQLARSLVGTAVLRNGSVAMTVGILDGPALAYAGVQEFGTRGKNPDSPFDTIRPRNAKALAIPNFGTEAVNPSGAPRFTSPRQFPGELVFIPYGRGKVIGGLFKASDAEGFDEGELDPDLALWTLMRAVDIEEKAYLLRGTRDRLPEIQSNLAKLLEGLLSARGGSAGAEGA